MQNFFRKGNLTVLRELALRRTADRVNADVQFARLAMAARHTWPTAERLLVCIGPSPTSAKVLRAAKRLADALVADWMAVHVATPQSEAATEADRQLLLQNLQLAERLGAETVQLTGEDVVGEILDYAGQRNVTKIVVGKTGRPRRRLFQRETLVDRLVRSSGDVDVYVVRGVGDAARVGAPGRRSGRPPGVWLGTGLVLAACTAVAWGFDLLGFEETNLVMVYLLGVVVVAAWFGHWPSALASVLVVLLFDLLFIEPRFAVTVHDTQYFVTFGVMIGVGLFASTLTARLRRQTLVSRRNERRTEALYRFSRQLSGLADAKRLVEQAEQTVSEVLDGYAIIFLPDEQGKVRPMIGHAPSFAASAAEFAAAQWVLDRGQPAGLGTDTLPGAQALYLPLATPDRVVGALALQPRDPGAVQLPETRQLLETMATQIAFAIERSRISPPR
jgi:two-component system sensor histidine kinase KdpD